MRDETDTSVRLESRNYFSVMLSLCARIVETAQLQRRNENRRQLAMDVVYESLEHGFTTL